MTKGEKIVALRERKGMRSVDLADKIGVSKQLMYKYENDIITNIPSDKLEMISSALDSSPAYLMGWEDEEGNKLFKEDIENDKRITDAEQRLLVYFRKLTEIDQARAVGFIQGLAQRD